MSEDSYTLKEMVSELRGEQKMQSVVLTQQSSVLENIEKHLAQLNSKVATHEKRFNGLETFQTKVMTMWGVAISVFVFIVNRFI